MTSLRREGSARSGGPRDELQLLSIFHWTMAFLTVMASLAPITWLLVDRQLREPDPHLLRTRDAVAAYAALMVGAGLLLAIGIGIAILVAVGAVRLARAEKWRTCVLASAALCLFFPLGTFLAVWTLGRLYDPAVRAAFADESDSSS